MYGRAARSEKETHERRVDVDRCLLRVDLARLSSAASERQRTDSSGRTNKKRRCEFEKKIRATITTFQINVRVFEHSGHLESVDFILL